MPAAQSHTGFDRREMLRRLEDETFDVLVIGGGDGGTIREVFKYPGIEKVTMVEIDEIYRKMFKISQFHIPDFPLSVIFDIRHAFGDCCRRCFCCYSLCNYEWLRMQYTHPWRLYIPGPIGIGWE